ncbi:MAG: GNAT family N-acetyltransferase [Erysipelotrichaceae bacterium]|nr:GNAT family N-acetyltransferase [Erysipelotrichaceae bacterium]
MEINLIPYRKEAELATSLIIRFWQEHNHFTPSYEDAICDLMEWTRDGHYFYFICLNGEHVGFVHLGSRGCKADWLEDIFVLPEFQGRGIGSRAIQLAEDIVKEYSDSLYIEVAARNMKAIRLYQRIGYDCLNTITIRKDFSPEKHEVIGHEKIMDFEFEVKKYSDN